MESDSIYISLTDANFQREVLENLQPVLVLFEADWSGACHIISTIIKSLAADFKGEIRFAMLGVDFNVLITKEYGIRTVPTLLFFKNGQVVDHIAGVISEKVLAAHLSALLQTE